MVFPAAQRVPGGGWRVVVRTGISAYSVVLLYLALLSLTIEHPLDDLD